MPADPQYDAVNPLSKPVSSHYGCHNKPRPDPQRNVESYAKDHKDQPVSSWPYRFSVDCKYDMSHKDSRCSGCAHARQTCSVYSKASFAPVNLPPFR